MTTTQNLNLPQWEETDRIQMDDFNDAMSKIDAAVAGKAEIFIGSYVGTGQYGSGTPNSITFPFEPRIIALLGDSYSGCSGFNGSHILIWSNLRDSYSSGEGRVWLTVPNAAPDCFGKKEGNTFSWYSTHSSNGRTNQFNESGRTYYYLAIA